MDRTNITVLLPAGRLPLDLMRAVNNLAEQYNFGLYLSQHQNLRLINVPCDKEEAIKQSLEDFDVQFKKPGLFPLPRICVGSPHCNLGQTDTEELSSKIMERFAEREHTKAKLKIAISACPLDCAWAKNSDIAVVATRNGYTMYAGGKGGPVPKVARRIKRKVSEQEVLDTILVLLEFHDRKTKTKQRMYKLLSDPDFPFSEV